LEGALHLSEPAHDVVDAARPEALLRDPEAVAGLAECVRERHADPGEARLAVRPPAATLVSHDRNSADELVAGRVGWDEDHRGAPVRLVLRVGPGQCRSD